MARRRGFFRRITDTIRKILRPAPQPEPPLEGGSGGDGRRTGPFWDAWETEVPDAVLQEIQDRTGYSEREIFQFHFETLYSLDPEADRETLQDMWTDYLMAFVNGEMSRDNFFNIWFIDPRDFDWAQWRNGMGYNAPSR